MKTNGNLNGEKKMKTVDGMEFKDGEIMRIAQSQKLVVKYRTIYAARYSENFGERLEKVYRYHGKLPLTKRGRFHVMSIKEVNKLLGFEIFQKMGVA